MSRVFGTVIVVAAGAALACLIGPALIETDAPDQAAAIVESPPETAPRSTFGGEIRFVDPPAAASASSSPVFVEPAAAPKPADIAARLAIGSGSAGSGTEGLGPSETTAGPSAEAVPGKSIVTYVEAQRAEEATPDDPAAPAGPTKVKPASRKEAAPRAAKPQRTISQPYLFRPEHGS